MASNRHTHLHGHDTHPGKLGARAIAGSHIPEQHQAQGIEGHQHSAQPQLPRKTHRDCRSAHPVCNRPEPGPQLKVQQREWARHITPIHDSRSKHSEQKSRHTATQGCSQAPRGNVPAVATILTQRYDAFLSERCTHGFLCRSHCSLTH